jgi:hypothetical protein
MAKKITHVDNDMLRSGNFISLICYRHLGCTDSYNVYYSCYTYTDSCSRQGSDTVIQIEVLFQKPSDSLLPVVGLF